MTSFIAGAWVVVSTWICVIPLIALYFLLDNPPKPLQQFHRLFKAIDESYFVIKQTGEWVSLLEYNLILAVYPNSKKLGSRCLFIHVNYRPFTPTKLRRVLMAIGTPNISTRFTIKGVRTDLPSMVLVHAENVRYDDLILKTLKSLEHEFLWSKRTLTKVDNVYHVANW